jgi:hypothetical protein
VNTKSPHIPTFFDDGNTGEVNKAFVCSTYSAARARENFASTATVSRLPMAHSECVEPRIDPTVNSFIVSVLLYATAHGNVHALRRRTACLETWTSSNSVDLLLLVGLL